MCPVSVERRLPAQAVQCLLPYYNFTFAGQPQGWFGHVLQYRPL